MEGGGGAKGQSVENRTSREKKARERAARFALSEKLWRHPAPIDSLGLMRSPDSSQARASSSESAPRAAEPSQSRAACVPVPGCEVPRSGGGDVPGRASQQSWGLEAPTVGGLRGTNHGAGESIAGWLPLGPRSADAGLRDRVVRVNGKQQEATRRGRDGPHIARGQAGQPGPSWAIFVQ